MLSDGTSARDLVFHQARRGTAGGLLRRCTISLLCVLTLGILLALAPPAHAADAELAEIIIENVLIVEPGDDIDPTLVSVQIVNGIVAAVSREPIVAPEGARVVDADQGYLLGSIEIGLPARFILLDQNPAEHFEVLSDTQSHTVFSIDGGQIVIDELGASVIQAADSRVTGGSISHQPPPVAKPHVETSDSRWNAFDGEHVTALLSAGIFLDWTEWLSQNDDSLEQPGVGDLTDFEGGTIRAFRFGVNGQIKLKRPWHYTVWVATNAFDADYDPMEDDSITFFDYRLDIPFTDNTTLAIGKQKEPISLERLLTLTWNPFQERTAAENAMLPSRNIGLVLSGTAWDQRVTWAGGLFNNWVDSRKSFNDNANQATGRVSWLPMVSDDEDNLFHLGAAFRYDDAKQGLRYQATPEVRNAPFFVDTDSFDADSSSILNLEASWRKGPLWISSELTLNDVDAPELENPSFSGWHILASWALTGEVRPYVRRHGVFGQLPIAQDVDSGGHGAFELALRWSEIDLTDGAIDGGEMQVAKVALTWWLRTTTNVSLNYQHVWNEKGLTDGEVRGFVVRLMTFTR